MQVQGNIIVKVVFGLLNDFGGESKDHIYLQLCSCFLLQVISLKSGGKVCHMHIL